jgi:predicted O-linked N-acetylglucosamine transferase (SPINDLY family)
MPLLSNHDRERFEIYCYAHLARPDEVSQRLADHADGWRLTYGASDAQVAQMIAADGIDILIDLTMHMANGRPMLFAGKPAPLQIAWLAYPGTTGIPAIDYRLTDPWLDPAEQGNGPYTEQSLHLPDTFWCYDPLTRAIAPNTLPAFDAGYVTFGCMNNFCKVTDGTLDLWGRVLAHLPSSRLLLLSPAGRHRERVLSVLGEHGVDATRIEFTEPRPRMDYLRHYHRIDICLDTIPYNGHTTSLDAFWMGVPVVTMVGDTIVGRAGWSQLNNLGMPELAAFDAQTFADIACNLAGDLPRLARMRQSLRGRMEASPLMDGPRFARAMEGIYERLFKGSAP